MTQQLIFSARYIRRKAYSLFLILTAILSLSGCSDDFLKEQPEIRYVFDPVYIESGGAHLMSFELPIKQASYQVRQYPKWLFFMMNGTISDGRITLSFRFIPDDEWEHLLISDDMFIGKSGDLVIDIQGVGLALFHLIVTKEPQEPQEPQKPQEPQEPQNPANVTAIEGRVMSAVYCKQTDRLFIGTQQPNKLLIYDKGEAVSEIALSKSPRCLSLSEDGKELFVGHSGLITRINSETLKITRSYELDFSVFSLVSGEDGWLYLSPDVDYVNEHLITLNLSSGSLLRNRLYNGYGGRMIIRKVKDKPVLLYTHNRLSPSGIAIVEIGNGTTGQEKYWHIDLGQTFVFSEDSKYLYGAYGMIFATPDFLTGEDLLPLGKIGSPYLNTNYIDHCAQTNSLWHAPSDWWEEKSYVSRYHAGDYYLIESFPVSDYATTVNGVYDYYRTIPHYVFSDRMGEKVFVIKNVSTRYGEGINAWSMETLHLKP